MINLIHTNNDLPSNILCKDFSIFFYNYILFNHQNNDYHLGHILREDGHSESLLSRAGVDLENVYFDESSDTYVSNRVVFFTVSLNVQQQRERPTFNQQETSLYIKNVMNKVQKS